jgi:hypothetical protein
MTIIDHYGTTKFNDYFWHRHSGGQLQLHSFAAHELHRSGHVHQMRLLAPSSRLASKPTTFQSAKRPTISSPRKPLKKIDRHRPTVRVGGNNLLGARKDLFERFVRMCVTVIKGR